MAEAIGEFHMKKQGLVSIYWVTTEFNKQLTMKVRQPGLVQSSAR